MKNIVLIIILLMNSLVLADVVDKKDLMLKHYSIVKKHLDGKKDVTQEVVDSAKLAFDYAIELGEKNEIVSTLGYYYLLAMDDDYNRDDKERVLVKLYEVDKGTKYF